MEAPKTKIFLFTNTFKAGGSSLSNVEPNNYGKSTFLLFNGSYIDNKTDFTKNISSESKVLFLPHCKTKLFCENVDFKISLSIKCESNFPYFSHILCLTLHSVN